MFKTVAWLHSRRNVGQRIAHTLCEKLDD